MFKRCYLKLFTAVATQLFIILSIIVPGFDSFFKQSFSSGLHGYLKKNGTHIKSYSIFREYISCFILMATTMNKYCFVLFF